MTTNNKSECKHIYNTMPEFKITGELECVKCRLPQNTVGDSLRKQEEREEKTKVINIRATPTFKRNLQRLAKSNGLSLTNYIYMILTKYGK